MGREVCLERRDSGVLVHVGHQAQIDDEALPQARVVGPIQAQHLVAQCRGCGRGIGAAEHPALLAGELAQHGLRALRQRLLVDGARVQRRYALRQGLAAGAREYAPCRAAAGGLDAELGRVATEVDLLEPAVSALCERHAVDTAARVCDQLRIRLRRRTDLAALEQLIEMAAQRAPLRRAGGPRQGRIPIADERGAQGLPDGLLCGLLVAGAKC